MTLVLSVHSRNSLWVVVDRRLSYGRGRAPVDDAVKVMELHTTDGVGVLAYAGLGATARGTQPSDWMSAVLRERGDLMFEQCLGVLSAAATKELPRHLARVAGGAHFIMVPAFIRGVGFRLYSIDNLVDPRTGRHSYRYTTYQRSTDLRSPSIRIGLAGTGGIYLHQKRTGWQRDLMSLVNAHDRGKISDHVIADELARLNYEAHNKVLDGTVGPRCIVMWQRRPETRRVALAAGQLFYTGLDRENQLEILPSICQGIDSRAVTRLLWKRLEEYDANADLDFEKFFDKEALDRLFAELPSEPDERLR